MKNNKGQVLVLFLLLLPIIIIFFASIIDSSLMLYNKNKLENINNDILSSINKKLDITEEYIKTLYSINDENIIVDEIIIDVSNISVKTHKEVNSIFGKIIGIDKYTISSQKKIKYKSNILMYFEINNNTVNSLDNREYHIFNNKMNFNYFNIYNHTLEIAFTNLNNTIFEIGNNIFSVKNNHLYLNENDIAIINEKNIIDIVGDSKTYIYLNNKYIKDIDNIEGDLIITTNNIKYVKLYEKILNNNNITNNYKRNRSWLNER